MRLTLGHVGQWEPATAQKVLQRGASILFFSFAFPFASLSATRYAEALLVAAQCNQSWMLVTLASVPYGYCAYTCGRCPQVDRQTPAAGALQ
jgi:hypothetical protein